MAAVVTLKSDGTNQACDCILARGWWYLRVEDGEARFPSGPYRTEDDALEAARKVDKRQQETSHGG